MATVDPLAASHFQILLTTSEKTLQFAQTQIYDGELINAKTMLDSASRQLHKSLYAQCSPEVEARREQLLRQAEEVKLQWQNERKLRLARTRSEACPITVCL